MFDFILVVCKLVSDVIALMYLCLFMLWPYCSCEVFFEYEFVLKRRGVIHLWKCESVNFTLSLCSSTCLLNWMCVPILLPFYLFFFLSHSARTCRRHLKIPTFSLIHIIWKSLLLHNF